MTFTTPALTVALTSNLPDSPTPKQLLKFSEAKLEKAQATKTRKEKGIQPLLLQVCFIRKMKGLVEEEARENMKNRMKRRMEDAMSKKVVDGELEKKRFRNEAIEMGIPMEH